MDRITEQVRKDEFAEKMRLEVLNKGAEEFITFSTVNVNRPGLFLSGFEHHFPAERVQVIGESETAFLNTLPPAKLTVALNEFFKQKIPCLIVSTHIDPSKPLLTIAKKHNCPVFRSEKNTTAIMNELVLYLNDLLAPTESRHGVLVDIYGIGVMLTGNSGVGKSETALELVQRGHRLVADDAVIIKRIADRLTGTSPPIIRYFMEVRGIGIVDIRSMYGVGAVMFSQSIDLVVEMELWNEQKTYDRIGLTNETTEILGVKVPKIVLPVKPGRNLAVLLEVAARNHRLKSLGYNSAEELDKRINF